MFCVDLLAVTNNTLNVRRHRARRLFDGKTIGGTKHVTVNKFGISGSNSEFPPRHPGIVVGRQHIAA